MSITRTLQQAGDGGGGGQLGKDADFGGQEAVGLDDRRVRDGLDAAVRSVAGGLGLVPIGRISNPDGRATGSPRTMGDAPAA